MPRRRGVYKRRRRVVVKTEPHSPYCADCGKVMFVPIRVKRDGKDKRVCIDCAEKFHANPLIGEPNVKA